ncbi:protein IQ-DOMAIN 31 [Lactuca sativa]|uniref:DUF4005 domain-containing protein n=1 Tax=Lactuca sativa TaxID=4236 RepID=A0A9R1WGG0_LACSA|nr:protein IQ-DOMAIN 31 [Lactuca sativa]XP_042755248.1 protein IQ-DOMAIN 31 [Lactuca sativa]XP_052624499.1 protein IQ-DOMAIN 31 [Lactuca sativa]XP_052624500.1 protein IQ-DOMAIN 31 [Lactuca sativa]KAJ0222387.1 hypothetical protein LSAT_V11C200083000 [Lactuca sativa]
MGKSPGKWIKTVFFGKKSSKSNLSKDATSEIKVSITGKTPSNNFGGDSMIISSPVRPVIDSSDHTELEKSSSANLITDTPENLTSHMDLTAITGEELIKLEQAATKAQAAFRGYLARRAFWALKGIIRLQALVRGHLVRRQAVATLKCMRAIVEFQALARGRKVRLGQPLQKHPSREFLNKKPSELLQTSIKQEKLSTNVFATKLVASSNTTMPLSFQYEPSEPNSVKNWLERWSKSHFWDPLPQPKKSTESKPKRKQTKLQSEETETGKPKRSVRKVPDNNLSNSSENEKSRRTVRKFSNHQSEAVQEQSINELEKVKRNLRKISLSTSEKSETETEKTEIPLQSPIHETKSKTNGSYVESVVKDPEAVMVIENKAVDDVEVIQIEQPPPPIPMEPLSSMEANNEEPANVEVVNGKEENNGVSVNGKESQKTRRRKSLPAKQEYNHESVSQTTPTLPSYMAATESAKAKLRAQAAAEAAENGGRRQSLPSSGGKPSLPSPRIQKPVVNGKGGSKPSKSQISPRDEKVMQAGWKR